jgi:hypothetical protein
MFLCIPNMYSKYTGMFLMTRSTFAEYQFGLQASTLYATSNHRWKETLHIQSTKTDMKQTDKKNTSNISSYNTEVKMNGTYRKLTYYVA